MNDPFEHLQLGNRDALEGKDDQVVLARIKTEKGNRALMLPASIRKKLDEEGMMVAAELQHAVREITKYQDAIDRSVEEAREMGLSWATIGWCVGLTAEGARKKWSDPDE